MEGITLGQIVHSRAGRDKDRYFIVIDIIDENYVLVADGDLRKIDSPKKKKIKHLVFHDKVAEEIGANLKENKKAVTDADLRKCLSLMGLL